MPSSQLLWGLEVAHEIGLAWTGDPCFLKTVGRMKRSRLYSLRWPHGLSRGP